MTKPTSLTGEVNYIGRDIIAIVDTEIPVGSELKITRGKNHPANFKSGKFKVVSCDPVTDAGRFQVNLKSVR
jgi:hypothetical protein